MEETVEARLLLRLCGLGEIDAAAAGSEVEGGVAGGWRAVVARAGDDGDAAAVSGGRASAFAPTCFVTRRAPSGDGGLAPGRPIVAVSVVVVIAQPASPGGAACGNGTRRASEPRGRAGEKGPGRGCNCHESVRSPDCPSAATAERQ